MPKTSYYIEACSKIMDTYSLCNVRFTLQWCIRGDTYCNVHPKRNITCRLSRLTLRPVSFVHHFLLQIRLLCHCIIVVHRKEKGKKRALETSPKMYSNNNPAQHKTKIHHLIIEPIMIRGKQKTTTVRNTKWNFRAAMIKSNPQIWRIRLRFTQKPYIKVDKTRQID